MTTQAPPANAQALPQQQEFMNAANGFDKVYSAEQNEVVKLQTEASNMTTWAQMLQFLATLSCLAQLMTATVIMSDFCAQTVDGVMQGAESIFSSGMEYVNNMSEQIWQQAAQNNDKNLDNGIPIPSVSQLNNNYSTQVANGQTFFYYLEDIVYDVSGAAFTAVDSNGQPVNPLNGIESSIDNAAQDIAFQMVSTFNAMYNHVNENGTYTAPSTGTPSSGTYAQDGNGNDYINNTTNYTDSGGSSPMNGANQGDIFCFFMLNCFFTYASPVQYTMDGESDPVVYAPGMTENPAAYQVETDMQTLNSTTTGFAPESMPRLGFLTNLAENCLGEIEAFLSDTAKLCQTIIKNTNI